MTPRAALLLALLLCGGCSEPGSGPSGGRQRDPFGSDAPAPEEGAAPAYRRRVALVVGITAYASLGKLEGPALDAADVAQVLATRFGFQVVLLVDRAPLVPPAPGVRLELAPEGVTRERLLAQLDLLRGQVGPQDALVFYFAGHGLKGHLVPSDGRIGEGLLAYPDLGRALRACDAHHTMAILDACFSGSAVEGLAAGLAALGPPSLRAVERDNLARVFNRRAFQVITAGTGGETVGDQMDLSRKYAERKDLEGHSPFTGVLLQGWRGLTGRPDGMLAGSELSYYLYNTLVHENELFRARQEPRFANLAGGDGDLLFIPVHAVLNPSLVAPLYVGGAEYSQLRRSACEALVRSVAARKKEDHGLLVEAAAPHLTRLLRDDAEGVRVEAARSLADLALLCGGAPVEEFRKSVPLLTALLARKGSREQSQESSRALGTLSRFATPEAVEAQKTWVLLLEKEHQDRLGGRRPPPEMARKIEEAPHRKWPGPAAPASERMASLEEFRALLEWLHGEGARLLADYERQHELGKELLQRAERHLQQRELFSARATATRALRAGSSEGLLWPGSVEERQARTILHSTPESRPIWRSAGPVHHATVVNALLLVPGGRSLASLDKSGTIRVWALDSGDLVGLLDGGAAHGKAMALSPDGSMIAAGGLQGTVALWDARTGTRAGTIQPGADAVTALAFSPDGGLLAVGGQWGKIVLVDPRSGQGVRSVGGHRKEVRSILFNAAGTRLVSASDDQSVRVWEAASGKELAAFTDHQASVGHLALHRDGKTLLSVDMGGCARFWDLERLVSAGTLREQGRGLLGCAFSADGTRVALSGIGGLAVGRHPEALVKWEQPTADGTRHVPPVFSPDGARIFEAVGSTIRTRDAATGAEIGVIGAHGEAVQGVAWSPDQRSFISYGMILRVWDRETGHVLQSLDGSLGLIRAAAYSGGGTLALGRGTQVELRKIGTLDRLWISEPLEQAITHISFAPDGNRLVVAAGQEVSIWDAAILNRKARFRCSGDGRISEVAFSPDGKLVAWTTESGYLEVADAATGGRIWTRLLQNVHGLAFEPARGAHLATGVDDQVVLWRVSTGEEILRIKTGAVDCLAFNPDGAQLAVGSREGARVWKLNDREKPAVVLGTSGMQVTSLEFSPDGREILLCESDRFEKGEDVLWIWETGLRRESFRVPTPEMSAPGLLAVSVAGRIFATAAPGPRGEVYLHDGITGRVIRKVEIPGEEVHAIALSADGTRLAAGIFGGVRLWNLRENGDPQGVPLKGKLVRSLAFDGAGARLAVGLQSDALRMLDAATGGDLGTFTRDPLVPMTEAGFTASGRLVAGDEEGYLTVWDAAGGPPVRSERVLREVGRLSCSPRDEIVACVGPRSEVALWDSSRSGGVRYLLGHEERAWSPRFSPDGTRLVTGGGKGELKIWDWKAGKELETIPAAWHWRGAVDFAPEGRELITTGDDQIPRFWSTGGGEPPPLPSYVRFEVAELAVRADPSKNLYRAEGAPPALRRLEGSLRTRFLNLLNNLDPTGAARLLGEAGEAERGPLRASFEDALKTKLELALEDSPPSMFLDLAARGRESGIDLGPVGRSVSAFEHLLAGRHEEAVKDLLESRGFSNARRALLLVGSLRLLKDPKREAEVFDAFIKGRVGPPKHFEDWLIFMLEGKTPERDLRASVEALQGDKNRLLGAIRYVSGIDSLARGDRDAARAAFTECAKLMPGPCLEGDLARAELERLK